MYSEEQIIKHGPLIYDWLQSKKTLKVQVFYVTGVDTGRWVEIELNSVWNPNLEYRVAPKPLYVNSIGEEFFDKEEYIYLVFFCDDSQERYTDQRDSSRLSRWLKKKEEERSTEPHKTISGALTAAAKYYKEKRE